MTIFGVDVRTKPVPSRFASQFSATFYFKGLLLSRRNIYTVIFKFNLLKSTVRLRLAL